MNKDIFGVIDLCSYRFELHELTANASANHLASSSANALPVNINIAFWLTVNPVHQLIMLYMREIPDSFKDLMEVFSRSILVMHSAPAD